MIVVQFGGYYARHNIDKNTPESDFMECLEYALCKDIFERSYCLYSGEKKDCGRCPNAGSECVKQKETMNHGNAIQYVSDFLGAVSDLSGKEYFDLLKKVGGKNEDCN